MASMKRRWLAAIVLIAIPFGLALRVIDLPEYPDEDIARAVSKRMWMEGTLDTNWRHLPEIASHYPSDQFNFSSAIVAAQPVAYAVSLATHGRYARWDLAALRWASAAFNAAALVLFFLAFARLWGPVTAALALAFIVASAQLFLASLYARPEAFVLFGFAAALLCVLRAAASTSGARLGWIGAAGAFCGLLAASKFSLVFVLAHLGLLHLALLRESGSASARRIPGEALAALAGFVAGFSLGAPGAIVDPAAFARGAMALAAQYAAPHVPYGRPGEPL